MVLRAIAIFLALTLAAAAAPAGASCKATSFEGASYTVCSFDPGTDHLALYNLDGEGQPYGSFSALRDGLQAEGKTLSFAMNAGMYDENLKPIGLYVEAGKQARKINRRGGGGNFHLKPNGVFYINGDTAGVMETEAFVKAGLRPDFATQSGPMLVIDGKIHPKFSAGGTSYKRRNGVGVDDGHQVIFAISEGAVNFQSFAMLFRDGLHCDNALFLDGSVSSLYSSELGRNDGFLPLGPMVGLAK